MGQLLGHEKLTVYRKAMDFAGIRRGVLEGLPRRVAACDHLDRGAESIAVNIAHASSSWSPKERIAYLGYANGSALECAACLDVFVAKGLLASGDVYPSKSLLAEIVSMLITMRKSTAIRAKEDHARYCTAKGRLFSHEDLDVYQASLQLSAWVEKVNKHLQCSLDLRTRLDKSTTAISLNIAEGTGRFTESDPVKFYRIAYKATVQSASMVDLATARTPMDPSGIEEGKDLLRRIAAMLTSLAQAGHKEA